MLILGQRLLPFEDRVMDSMANRFRNLDGFEVVEVGRIKSVDQAPGLLLLDPDGAEWIPATEWLLQLTDDDRSPHTVRV